VMCDVCVFGWLFFCMWHFGCGESRRDQGKPGVEYQYRSPSQNVTVAYIVVLAW
jgi:hypothetical protein